MDADGNLQATPLDEVPLHGFTSDPGQWWACTYPERPADEWAMFDGRCPKCLIAAQADLATGGTTASLVRQSTGVELEFTLAAFIERARAIQAVLRGELR